MDQSEGWRKFRQHLRPYLRNRGKAKLLLPTNFESYMKEKEGLEISGQIESVVKGQTTNNQ